MPYKRGRREYIPKLQTNVIPFGCGINNGGQTEVPRLETGTLPLHARSSPSITAGRDGRGTAAGGCCCPATSFCVSVALLPVSAPGQIFIAPVLAFSPAHLGISCHHALTRLALCPLILSRPVSVCHKTRRFWTLPVTMKLNILLFSSRFGICKI